MIRFDSNSLAIMEMALHWTDGVAQFTDRIIARRVNAWRDIFPGGLRERLDGKGEGETVSLDFGPGELVPPRTPTRVLELGLRRFRGRAMDGKTVSPCLGRFYPLGMFSHLAGVYPSTMTPGRVTYVDGDTLILDRNHPMAGYPIRLEASIQTLQAKSSETGGQLSHWGEELCDNGPGMQARLPSGTTDFLVDGFLDRPHDDDASFYAEPRIIGHVDRRASENIASLYARLLQPGMRVLDLMSSVQSHLPEGMDLDVVGLGMNADELSANPALSERLVHDLNRDPAVPLSGPFDAALISLSIEYLTDPVAVLHNVREQLAPGGVILVATSNRWFPGKAVRGWTELHEFERVGYILHLLTLAGFTGPMGAESIRNDWRPQDDPHFLETRGVSDPVYRVYAHRGD
ncbi:hypothetical protein [Pseudodesulfovibrio sp.]|uniref:hypothetical protein n=1 Tax=unclassified Pseudodesulfovibrio TaxID=2661612 RepID=UPI003AFFF9E1